MWKNVLHKSSGKRLTFEIILGNAPMWYPENLRFSQSQIWISYQNVSSINTDFTYGIEDQQGAKGLGGHLDGTALEDFNGRTIRFYQSSNSYFLKRLTLTFQDTNSNTTFEIMEEDPNYTRGYHILLDTNKPSEPDPTYMFAKAFAGSATLLIAALSPPGSLIAAAGFMLDVVLVTTDYMDLVDTLAYKQYSGIQINVFDMNDGLWQKANCSALTLDYAVDASLSVLVHWILKTPNDSGYHSLTITAITEYYEQSITTGEIIPKNPISTSVNLKIGPDNNNTPDTAYEISACEYDRLYIGGYDADDYYKIHLDAGYVIYVNATGIGFPKPVFYLDLYDPNGIWKNGTSYAYSNSLEFTADSTGNWLIRVHIYDDTHGFYNLYVSVYYPSGGGGGCPILYVWNGSDYACEGLLNIHNPDRVDIITNHTLVTTPAWVNGVYKLRLVEHPQTHSYIDQVELYAILADGKVVNLPLIYAWHSEYGNVLPQLLLSDDWKTDTLGANWNNGVSQSIDLKFAALPPNIKAEAFIFRIEGNNPIAKT